MYFKGIILILSQFNCILLLTLLCCGFGNAKNHAYFGVKFLGLKFWWCNENDILQVWLPEYTLIWWSPIWCHFKDIRSYPRLFSKKTKKVQQIFPVQLFRQCAQYIVWANWSLARHQYGGISNSSSFLKYTWELIPKKWN